MFSLSSIAKKIIILLSSILVLFFFSKIKAFARPIISNANDVSFTVSWISATPAIGEVHYGLTSSLGNTAYDTRGSETSSNIHYVKIFHLLPETTYYFDIVTGGVIDNNGGVHYSFTTGPTSETPPGTDTAFGQVVLPDGLTPANGALVYITIRDDDGQGSAGRSTPLSSLVDSGYWNIQLADARILDMSSPFEYSLSGDILDIYIYAPDGSTANVSIDTENDAPAPTVQTDNICLDEVCDFIDNDCDGLVDEQGAQGCTIFYKDEDEDGYGISSDSMCLCAKEARYTASQGGDPNDQNPLIIPFPIDMEISSGWSMVSLPLIPGNSILSILFPQAKVVYGYKKGVGYERVKEYEEIIPGTGYWLLLDQNRNYPLIGEAINKYTLQVEEGWYMIGGCTYSAKASVNTGSIAVIYRFVAGTGYQRVKDTENLEPGKGYWILFKNIIDLAELTVESIEP